MFVSPAFGARMASVVVVRLGLGSEAFGRMLRQRVDSPPRERVGLPSLTESVGHSSVCRFPVLPFWICSSTSFIQY